MIHHLLHRLPLVLLLPALLILAATSARAQDGPIKVGEYGSLSGAEATFGHTTHNGILLAVEEQNAAGGINGRKIELVSYDDRGDSKEVGTVVERLINSDKVSAVLGEVASSLSLAGGAVCQQYQVPMISPSSTNPRVTIGRDMVFRVCFIDPFQGYVVARFAKDNLKVKKVAVLYDQAQAYSKGLRDAFKTAWEKLGGEVCSDQAYSSGDADFSAQLINIRSSEPDAVFLPGYYTDVGNIALQARKLDINVPLLGGDGWDSEQLIKIAGKALEGCYYSSHYSHEDARPEAQEFVKKYRAKFQHLPNALAAAGYDAAKLLFDAMGRSKSLAGKDLAAAIAASVGFQGVTGVITINKDRNADKPAVVLQIKNGQSTFLTSIAPPKAGE